MSKARTLADFISDGSEFADGTISVAEVSGAAPLASPTFTGTASGTFSGPLTGNVTGNVTGDLTGDVTGNVTGNLTGNVTGDVAGDIDLSTIAATIADTAVDIFVYDTRKDSDGGAWRKRTQHTSWYNETLNTSTRGSRKEFPAVAVIVAEATDVGYVTIYDGDDPDLPMWMVLSTDTQFVGANTKSVSALNGIISVGLKDDRSLNNYNTYETRNRLDLFHFISDKIEGSDGDNSGSYFGTVDGISNRGTLGTNLNKSAVYVLVNSQVNDVAMTVLPNAPIDAATGLPVPTIAVATEGGISVILDDGTVTDSLNTNPYSSIDFLDDGSFVTRKSSGTVRTWRDYQSDGFEYHHNYNQDGSHPYLGNNTRAVVALDGDVFLKTANGSTAVQSIVAMDVNKKASGMSHFITTNYATGWQQGDIKLATLSDTDDTNVTGSELITNGSMEANNSWEAVGTPTASGQTSAQAHSGTYSWYFTGDGNYDGIQSSVDFSITSGKAYVIDAWVYPVNDTGITLKFGGVNRTVTGLTQGAWNQVTETIVSTQTTTAGTIGFNTDISWGGGTWYIDDVSVRLAEEDRSVNGNGLQVFGTVPKVSVATGSDLVAYGTFSNNIYLEQPYNSDLDFGTGDFSVMTWVKVNPAFSAADYIFSRGTHLGYALNAYGSEYTFYADGTGLNVSGLQTGVWQFICCGVRGGQRFISLNAGEEQTSAISTSVDEANATLIIGNYSAGSSAFFRGLISLFRISATAPSPEQIKKIYEDEKVLFQEGAQATLYGTSETVNGAAYDKTTGLLHIGTSDGRSVFQGLRRVDNTTTAVGAAISASNGLVADE
jgi:hypothetical protein